MEIKRIRKAQLPDQLELATTTPSNGPVPQVSEQRIAALEKLHAQYLVPISMQQDPRIPPQGRVLGAVLSETPAGYKRLTGEVEWFDKTEESLQDTGERSIRVRPFPEPTIIHDSHFDDEASQEGIYELKVLLDGRVETEYRIPDPFLSVFRIGASYPFGGIHKRFHERIDKHKYKNFKGIMHHMIQRKTRAEERLIVFMAGIHHGNSVVNAEVILTNPKGRHLNRFFEKGLQRFDRVFQQHYKPGKHYRRMVYAYENQEFRLCYVVLRNGVPLIPRMK